MASCRQAGAPKSACKNRSRSCGEPTSFSIFGSSLDRSASSGEGGILTVPERRTRPGLGVTSINHRIIKKIPLVGQGESWTGMILVCGSGLRAVKAKNRLKAGTTNTVTCSHQDVEQTVAVT